MRPRLSRLSLRALCCVFALVGFAVVANPAAASGGPWSYTPDYQAGS